MAERGRLYTQDEKVDNARRCVGFYTDMLINNAESLIYWRRQLAREIENQAKAKKPADSHHARGHLHTDRLAPRFESQFPSAKAKKPVKKKAAPRG